MTSVTEQPVTQWLLIADGEGSAITAFASSDDEIVQFLWEQCGPTDGDTEEQTRAYWRERLIDTDNYWQSRDGYPRWRCEFDIGETGHISIQRINHLRSPALEPVRESGLTDEQRDALEWAIGQALRAGDNERCATLREILTTGNRGAGE